MKIKSYSTFEKKYIPIENKDGDILYETYGKDVTKVLDTPVDHVWTIVDCDGKLVITAGYHIVNRMNYMITMKPWKNNAECYRY